MKTYLVSLLLISSLFIACKNTSNNTPVVDEKFATNSSQTATTPQAGQVMFEKMDGYFLKNNIKLENQVSGFVFTDNEAFMRTCGIARTMSNAPDTINFSESIGIAVAHKSTNLPTELIFESMKLEGDTLYVTISVKTDKANPQSYTSLPFALAKVRKEGIKEIVFLQNDKEFVRIPVKPL